jgi:hypothetical protein
VVGLAREVLDAGDPGQGGRRQRAHRGDEIARPVAAAVLQGDLPGDAGLVEGGGLHRAPELDVAAQVERVGDVVQVALGLGLGREVLGPVPFGQQLVAE